MTRTQKAVAGIDWDYEIEPAAGQEGLEEKWLATQAVVVDEVGGDADPEILQMLLAVMARWEMRANSCTEQTDTIRRLIDG